MHVYNNIFKCVCVCVCVLGTYTDNIILMCSIMYIIHIIIIYTCLLINYVSDAMYLDSRSSDRAILV